MSVTRTKHKFARYVWAHFVQRNASGVAGQGTSRFAVSRRAGALGTNNDPALGDAIAMSANGLTLAVASVGHSNVGAVHVFRRSSRTRAFVRLQTLVAPVGSTFTFGTAVALSADGKTIAIGTTETQNGSVGSIKFLSRSSTTTAFTGAGYTLYGPTGSRRFGSSIAFALNDLTLLVGDPDLGSVRRGAVHIYTRTRKTSAFVTPQQTLMDPALRRRGVDFGRTLALSADGLRLAVGDWQYSQAGGVHIFLRSRIADVFPELPHGVIVGPGGQSNFNFSFSTALAWDGTNLLVGESNARPSEATSESRGAIHIYALAVVPTGRENALTPTQSLFATDGRRFGRSIAVGTRTMAVGDEIQAAGTLGAVRLFSR